MKQPISSQQVSAKLQITNCEAQQPYLKPIQVISAYLPGDHSTNLLLVDQSKICRNDVKYVSLN